MPYEQLELTPSCKLEAFTYGETTVTDVSLEYVEHSPDSWYSNSNTSVGIDKETAQKMVDFLCKHFNINRTLPTEST